MSKLYSDERSLKKKKTQNQKCFLFLFRSRPHAPKANEIKTKGRFIWELFHKNLGRLALFLALINISLGFFLALVPSAVWAVWFVLLGLYIIAHITMEVRFTMKKKKLKVVTIAMN